MALSWIRRPIPNKTTFVVLLGHYEWNEMPFDLKDTLSEFQNIIDENFNQFSVFIIVFIVKSKVKTLPCLGLVNPKTFGVVETDASDIGYGRILKQSVGNLELLVRYTSGTCNTTQFIHNIIKKEILSIVICISKFQNDLLNQKFLLRIDCRSVNSVLQNDIKNIAFKHIFCYIPSYFKLF